MCLALVFPNILPTSLYENTGHLLLCIIIVLATSYRATQALFSPIDRVVLGEVDVVGIAQISCVL